MKRVRSTISKILRLVAIGSTSVFLAACYGVGFYIPSEVEVTFTDEEGTPIPGLKINGRDDFLGTHWTTDESGEISFTDILNYGGNYDFFVEDLDGSSKGGYFGSTKQNLTIEIEDTLVANESEFDTYTSENPLQLSGSLKLKTLKEER